MSLFEDDLPSGGIKSSKSKKNSVTNNSEGDQNVLKINKKFAAKFESEGRLKDLQRAKEVLADGEDESDSESEDDDAEQLSASLDLQIVKTINSIRKKDPKIYDSTTTWFENNDDDDDDDDEDDDENGNGKHKKKTYKDVLRQQLLERGADIEGEDDDEGDSYLGGAHKSTSSLAYNKEQEKLRRAFIDSAGTGGGGKSSSNSRKIKKSADDNDDDDDDDDEMLQVKHKNPEELEKEDRELQEAILEMAELGKKNYSSSSSSVSKIVAKDLEKEAFLTDYIAKKKWQQPNATVLDPDDSDNDQDSDDLDQADKFESSYNFRFEELQGGKEGTVTGTDKNNNNGRPQAPSTRGVLGMGNQSANQVTGHSRTVEGSLRRVDDKRKVQREAREERKGKERRQKEAELMRLKNLKKQELQARLKQIREVGGLGASDRDDGEYGEEEEEEEKEEEAEEVKGGKKRKGKKGRRGAPQGTGIGEEELEEEW